MHRLFKFSTASLCAALLVFLSQSAAIAAPVTPFTMLKNAAEAARQSRDGEAYQNAMPYLMGRAMRTCIPPNKISDKNKGHFEYVALISKTGRVATSQIQPKESAVAQCFKQQMDKQQYLVPPTENALKAGYPVYVDINVS